MQEAAASPDKYYLSDQSFSIQHLHRREPYSMEAAHFHPFYEIYYLLRGERIYFINDKVYSVSKGDLIILNPYDMHRTDGPNGDSQGFERILVNFTHEFMQPVAEGKLRLLPFTQDAHLIRFPLKEQPVIEGLLWGLLGECRQRQAGHEQGVQALLLLLLIRIQRAVLQTNDRVEHSVHPMHQKISEIASYLSAECHQRPTLEQVAQRFFISPSHLSRVFKSITGLNFRDYMLLLRMKEAQRMLRETNKKVQLISEECGFVNIAHFNKAFKKIVGVSPLQYRKLSNGKGRGRNG
ncbi:AraC family transcriptional regulator [Paenibacillus chartarius]|uniref:AraC family transcriptional regulator n=1 Tax=Paenibacillus chartarius TaxID=747481 RepID=A0ABV6DSB7_9BACL